MMEIGAALAAVKGTLDIARVAVEARDDSKVKAALSDMESRLAGANTVALSLSEAARALSAQLAEADKQLREAQARIAEREKYVLYEVTKGCFVYRFAGGDESPVQGGVPSHYLCQNCFDRGIKSVLRLKSYASFNDDLVCAENAAHAITL